MQTIGEVLTNARADSPWLVLVAGALLAAAAQVARRLFGSVARIGSRVGDLERLTDSERTRRQQVESVLLELGVPLPIWPGDPAPVRELAVLRRRDRDRDRDDEDQGEAQPDPYPLTTERPAPPPPLRATSAAHRR